MQRNITLSLIIFLIGSLQLFAAPPTVPASSLVFSGIDGASLSISFTRGNGAFRIVVMKEASAVTGLPLNGTEYTHNSNFATAGTEFTAAGEYVVYKGTANSFTISKLKPSTIYHLSVFEYNGSGIAADYLMIPLSGSQSTASAPSTQASGLGFTNVAGSSVTLNWTKGNGARRIVVARKGAPVNATPEDLKTYAGSVEFGDGHVISGDNYVVYQGAGTQVTITKLEPATNYHFAIFEYNGSSFPIYLKPGATHQVTTNAGPTQASKNINFSTIEGNALTMSMSTGNGAHQLIIARKNAPVTAVPVNGVAYTASTVFGQGTEIAPGEFVLNTTAGSRTFTNLEPYTVYHFRAYDFDMTSGGQTYYLTGTYAEKSQSTAVAPTSQASGINFINVTGTAAGLRFTAGNGSYRLSVIKEGSPVDADPADLTKYSANGAFGSGAQISPGNYAIGSSNSAAVNITNLTPGKTYHVAIFEFNGDHFPVYMRPAATGSISLPAQPTQPSTAFFASVQDGNSLRLNWTSGNGSKRLIVGKKGSAVTARPADGTAYTAHANFGQGQQIAPGEFVVYDGSFSLVDLSNLEANSTYHFAVFEYNPSATGPDYLTTSFLAGTGTTVGAPSVQVTAISAGNIQSNQATISFTKGNGAARLFLMRENAPVNIDPQDLVSYGYNLIYGNAQVGSTGNYSVNRTNNNSPFTVTNLAPSTVYHVAAFELNGSNGPVYLRPAATYSFTTAAGTGITAPTVAASNPAFTNTEGNKFSFNWTNGNGSNRLVVIKQGSAVTFTPANSTSYTANGAFGSGTDLGGGQYAVYNGTLTNTVITNLTPGATYHIAVFEYNGSGSNTRYLTSSFLSASGSTAVSPATGSSNPATLAGNQSITLNWTVGSGNGRMVVMKAGGAVTAAPANLSAYPANSVFGNGSQVAAGEYVVYSGGGNNVVVTGLTPNTTYYYKIYEYNGAEAPIYNTVNAVIGSATTTAALPVKWLYFTARENNSNEVVLEWATANEQRAAKFVAERSVDNRRFTAIDSLPAKGGLGNNTYSLVDGARASGAAYYRIKEIDVDGRFEYSKLIRVEASGKKAGLNIYPSLVLSECRVSLPQGVQQATLVVYDMRGVQVKALKVQNGEFLSFAGLPAGTYSVNMRNGEDTFSVRIVKQ